MAEMAVNSRLVDLLNQPTIKAKFNSMLGERTSAFFSSLMSIHNSSQQLKECDPMSIVAAAAVAASMDMPINPSLGWAYIIPYKGVATFQLGWKGIYQLAMRSRQYEGINPCVIYEGQLKSRNSFKGTFEFQEERKSNETIGYLLYFKLLSGFEKYFYMSKEEMEVHAKRYSVQYKKGNGYWVDDFDGQGIKTVIKLGLQKYGPLSVEMVQAFNLDGAEVDEKGEVKRYVDKNEDPEPAKPVSTSAEAAASARPAGAPLPAIGAGAKLDNAEVPL